MLLVVVGTGLMGGSFALAARRLGLFERVVGVDPDPENGRQALALGVVDAVAESVPDDADAVLLAGPSHTVAPWVATLRDHRASIFDTASVKGALLDEVRGLAGTVPARFVPCHPVTGSERSGPAAADAGLYRDAEVIVTPTAGTDAETLLRVEGWWRAVGARVCAMEANVHDRVLARTSHLPHLLAFTYLQLIDAGHLPHTAGGFRDFTRIGASDPAVWAPILRLNREAVLGALDEMEGQLGRVRGLIEAEEGQGLLDFLHEAVRRRGGGSDGG